MIETKVYQIDLPLPSQQLIATVNDYVTSVNLLQSSKEWLDEFHHNKINSALHLFSTDDNITALVNHEYGKFFPGVNLVSVIGIMKNSSPDSPACQPPHIDRYRALAINYYINLGGDQVQTSFYDYEESTQITESKNFQYSDFKKIGHCIFDKQHWYAYNVSQCHSIENITDTRYFLSIALADNPGYKVDDLLNNTSIKGKPVNLWNRNN